MKTFLVTFKINIPYPMTFDYRVKAGQPHVAVARAFKMLRRDVPRKRIDHYGITVVPLISIN